MKNLISKKNVIMVDQLSSSGNFNMLHYHFEV